MNNNAMVWHVEVHADIFSKDFCEQLHLDRIEWPPVDQPFYYDLGIRVSSVNIYDTERIRQYLFDHDTYRSLGDLREEFDAILGEQFKPVYEAFKSLGYVFGNTFIYPGGMDAADSVKIFLFRGQEKEYDKKGKLKKIFTVHSNIPHGVGFGNFLDKYVAAVKADLQIANSSESGDSQAIGSQDQIVFPSSSDSQITLHKLFEALAAGVPTNAIIHTTQQYRILQNNPLLIESRSGESRSDSIMDTVTRPQWCLYTETKDHAWNILAFSSGDDLQRKLLGICKKRLTRIAVPFCNLKPIEYTLSAKLFSGYTKIPLAKAYQYSDLQIMWNHLTGL